MGAEITTLVSSGLADQKDRQIGQAWKLFTQYHQHGSYIVIFFSLYEFFAEGQCRRLEYDANFVILTQEFGEYQTYHEAGWDSFCTGNGKW